MVGHKSLNPHRLYNLQRNSQKLVQDPGMFTGSRSAATLQSGSGNRKCDAFMDNANREHIDGGLETQRQWADLAIARTTPCLLGLFSLVALMADRLSLRGELLVRGAAWCEKDHGTFADALAAVRRQLWQRPGFSMSDPPTETLKISQSLFERLIDAVC